MDETPQVQSQEARLPVLTEMYAVCTPPLDEFLPDQAHPRPHTTAFSAKPLNVLIQPEN